MDILPNGMEVLNHKTFVKYDGLDDGPVVFKWHWPRGTFAKRMSALEIAGFLMPHMPHIVPLLSDHPRVQAEFRALLVRLATWPAAVLDEVVPWIKSVTRAEEDEIIELNLFSREAVPSGPLYFGVN